MSPIALDDNRYRKYDKVSGLNTFELTGILDGHTFIKTAFIQLLFVVIYT